MRILKFRAWDARCRDMAYFGLGEDHFGTLDMDTNEFYTLNLGDNPPVMQFTGLLDMDGKEIYEGDIVMVINYLNGKPWTGHVHPCAVESVPGGFELKDHWHHESLRSSELEVIGNIYENPDMLK